MFEDNEFDTYWDYLTDCEIATRGEIGVACHFGGHTAETLKELLFYRTGYRSIEQMERELNGDE